MVKKRLTKYGGEELNLTVWLIVIQKGWEPQF